MTKVKLKGGAFAGFDAEVVEDLGDQVRVSVLIFGKATAQTVPRDAIAFPATHESLREQLAKDEQRHLREAQRLFWTDRALVTGCDARDDWIAFQTWLGAATIESQARTTQRLADFERELGGLSAEEAQARIQGEPARWSSPAHRVTSNEEHNAGRKRRLTAELAGALLELLEESDAARWAEVARVLERWDGLQSELRFPSALSGAKMIARDVGFSAYVGAGGQYRLVFEVLNEDTTSSGADNRVIVVAPEGENGWHSFHGTIARQSAADPNRAQQCWTETGRDEHRLTPTFADLRRAGVDITEAEYQANMLLASEQVLYTDLHLRKERYSLTDPPGQLGFPAEEGPWRAVWRDRGLHIVDHLHLDLTNPGADEAPSTTVYFRALAVAVVTGKPMTPPIASDPLEQLAQVAWSDGGRLRDEALERAVTQLHLGHRAEVTSLAACARLSQLKALYVGNTNVTELEPLRQLTKLTDLGLSSTLITSLEPLSGLVGLQTLSLQRTQIADLAPLARLQALRTLDIQSTAVTDLSPLLGLQGLRRLIVSIGVDEPTCAALRAKNVDVRAY